MHTDGLLASTDIEDALAQVYIAALAAKAGYLIVRRDFDRDSVDITVEAGGHMRPKLDVQLKATINLVEVGEARDTFSYHCSRRNYELLRLATQTPRILVVMRLPKEPRDWLSINPHELIMRHCAYWVSLLNAPEIDEGKQGKSVHLPKANRLDDEALRMLMEQSRSGRIA